MLNNVKQHVKVERFRVGSLTAVAVIGLIIGLILACGTDWTRSVAAHTSENPALPTRPPVLQESFAPLAERLSPAVVNVKVTKVEKTAFNPREIPEGPFGDMFRRFFNDNLQLPNQQPVKGAGSGVIISEEGFILTNNHVVEGAREVTVTLADQKELKADIVGRDPKTDLAVLKIPVRHHLPTAQLGNSDQLKVGDRVIAIGNPFGLTHTVTSGIVSAKGRVIGAGPYDDFIQTDASINPGNSGGPLFNMNGEVVGINTAIIPNGQGIGFAIPVNTAKPLIPQLVKDGKVTRGYLGVNIQSITPEIAAAMKLPGDKGALVADVMPDGPASKAGFQRGDIILAYNGKRVQDSHDLPAMVAESPVGQEATVTLLRNGEKKEMKVTVAELPSDKDEVESSAKPEQGKWGLELQNVTPEMARRLDLQVQGGVMVSAVHADSPADKGGIRRGDMILEVNRHPVTTVEDVTRNIAGNSNKDALLLLVQRDSRSLFVGLSAKQ